MMTETQSIELKVELGKLYTVAALLAAKIRGPAAFKETYETVKPTAEEMAEAMNLLKEMEWHRGRFQMAAKLTGNPMLWYK